MIIYIVYYDCPKCGCQWEEYTDSISDSECPRCDCDNITPYHYEYDYERGE